MESEMIEYFRILWKRVWVIVIVTVLLCGATGVYSFLKDIPIYQASSKLIVNTSDRQDGKTGLDFNQISSNLLLIETYKEIITARTILEKVIAENPGLVKDTNELSSKISVGSSSRSQVMSITVKDESYTKAVQLVNAVSEVFQRETPNIMSVNNVTILTKADMLDPAVKVSSGIMFKVVIAFVLALMISIVLIFVWEYMDDTFKSERDVSRLGVPTLAVISHIKRSDWGGKSKHPKKQVGDKLQIGINQ
ncbi:capsular polysaccharide biosynthesis protein CpsC [Cohnella abietis]|uniref:Capsular polysaccharide biosynthesis protein CpsC n=2 Tax=Cohnella abietis TaxID=2507935 RepID=A0A3T1D151_9BACL|nr:capsular polysaccharide biosynthesis protein CpsC [Cohnella abietis]